MLGGSWCFRTGNDWLHEEYTAFLRKNANGAAPHHLRRIILLTSLAFPTDKRQ